MPVLHLTYVGPNMKLVGKTALVYVDVNTDSALDQDGEGPVDAQFDGHHLTVDDVDLSHGWHRFRRSNFGEDES